MECTQKTLNKYLRTVKNVWPACADIKRINNRWEVAILNTMGGLHWMDIRVIPKIAEAAINKLDNEENTKI